MTALTPAAVREIAAESGLAHAEFCVEQETTQIGRVAADPLWAVLSELAFAAQESLLVGGLTAIERASVAEA